MQTGRLQKLGCPLVVALIAVAFGWPTRNGEFLSGDDQRLVTEHYLVNHPSTSHAVELFTTTHGDLYQPLPLVSFQLDYARAEPTPSSRFPVSARPFHLTNIALHALNAILVYLLATRISGCRRIGLLTGLMFACHPFALEPVAWVNGRMMLLATLFSLLTIYLCIRSPESRPWESVLACLAWISAILSKIIPTVPIAAAVCDVSTHGRLSRRRAPLYIVLLLLAVAGTYVALRTTQQAGFVEGMQSEAVASAPVRALLATRYYIENYAWPGRLAAWSPPLVNEVITSPPVLIAILEIILLASIAVALRRRLPLVTLGIVLFVILLAPLLAAGAARKFLAADRYMYLPIVGLHLALAAAAVAALDWIAARSTRLRGDLLVGMPTMLILAAWMSYSWHLAPTWASTVARDMRVVAVYPDSELAHAELAKAYNFEGDPDAALHVIEQARRNWPNSGPLAAAAGDAYRLKGDYENAQRELEIAVQQMPEHLLTRYRLGQVVNQLGDTNLARKQFDRILQLNPDYLPAIVAKARLEQATGNIQAAIDGFSAALEINPFDRDSRFALATNMMVSRNLLNAIMEFRALLSQDPADARTKLNLAACLAQTWQNDEALQLYDELIATGHDQPRVLANRAAVLFAMGRSQEAEKVYQNLLKADPVELSAVFGLSAGLQSQGRFDEMRQLWRTYIEEGGNKNLGWAWLAWSAALSGNELELDQALANISNSDEYTLFGDWIRAFVAFKNGDDEEFLDLIGDPVIPQGQHPHRSEQYYAIFNAIGKLIPSERKDTSIGYYAGARASLFGGELLTAAFLARSSLEKASDPEMKKKATQLLELLPEISPGSSRNLPISQSAPH